MSNIVANCQETKAVGECWERDCTKCDVSVFERNNYFCGKLMVERDFWCDQQYHMSKQRLHNKDAHGWGTLCGLKVKQHGTPACRDKYVILEPGVALDCCGREIVVGEEQYIPLPQKYEQKSRPPTAGTNRRTETEKPADTLYIAIRYRECYTEPVPSLFSECGCEEKCQPNRIRDTFGIKLFSQAELKITPPIYGTDAASIDINRADINELKRFFNISSPLAQKIIASRPFKTPSDLSKVSAELLEKNRGRTVVGEKPATEPPCADIHTRVIDPCPVCPPEPLKCWVILASVPDYSPGDTVVDKTEKKPPTDARLIDNFTHRRLVPSTDVLYQIIRCLIEKGVGQKGEKGDNGEPGKQGPKGDTGSTGAQGIPGKDGIGLDPKLPKIINIDPAHKKTGVTLSILNDNGIRVYFDRDMDEKTIDENTFTVFVKLPNVENRTYTILPVMPKDISYHQQTFMAKFVAFSEFTDYLRPILIKMTPAGLKPACHVLLKGDFITDKYKLMPLDANHITRNGNKATSAKLPSGDWVPGGYFEFWFYLTP